MGSRASASLHRKIEKLNRAIEAKEQQLYSLYDVCEAHKVELVKIAGDVEGEGGEEGELPREVERTLENVLEARGRRVEFESEEEGSEWPGISDTEGM